jgi:CheY-like chemotaxis protein
MDPHGPAVEALENPPAQSTRRRLLVIEDHAPFRQTLTYLLRAAGHTVEEAENGPAGLANFRLHPPDLVITDRDMPGLSGWEVARLVKTMQPRIPVILVTGAANTGATGQQDPACVDAILWKPFSFSDLIVLIGRFTGGAPAAAGPAAGGTLRRSPA